MRPWQSIAVISSSTSEARRAGAVVVGIQSVPSTVGTTFHQPARPAHERIGLVLAERHRHFFA
jgi:hypothetical protein